MPCGCQSARQLYTDSQLYTALNFERKMIFAPKNPHIFTLVGWEIIRPFKFCFSLVTSERSISWGVYRMEFRWWTIQKVIYTGNSQFPNTLHEATSHFSTPLPFVRLRIQNRKPQKTHPIAPTTKSVRRVDSRLGHHKSCKRVQTRTLRTPTSVTFEIPSPHNQGNW